MSSVQFINPKADYLRSGQALTMNINGASGLKEVLISNLGPQGTNKVNIFYKNFRCLYLEQEW